MAVPFLESTAFCLPCPLDRSFESHFCLVLVEEPELLCLCLRAYGRRAHRLSLAGTMSRVREMRKNFQDSKNDFIVVQPW